MTELDDGDGDGGGGGGGEEERMKSGDAIERHPSSNSAPSDFTWFIGICSVSVNWFPLLPLVVLLVFSC